MGLIILLSLFSWQVIILLFSQLLFFVMGIIQCQSVVFFGLCFFSPFNLYVPCTFDQ